MKKILLPIVALLGVVTLTQAQETVFGAKAGVNIANFGYNYAVSSDEPNTDSRLTYVVGGFADIGVSDKFSVRPELLLSAKGSTNEENILGTTVESTLRLTYIEVPVYAVYKLDAGSGKFMINAGPYLGFGLGGELEVGDQTADVEFNSEEGDDPTKLYVRGLDFGFIGGVGYQLESGISINANYGFGLSNLTPDDPSDASFNASDFKQTNTVFRITVGYAFQ